MKVLKISVLVLVLSIIISSAGVFATNVKKYAGINLPAFSGNYMTGKYFKEAKGRQYYQNEYNLNNCTGNYNDVDVRLTNEQGESSAWMTVGKGATSSWADNSKSNESRFYKLTIKNSVWGLCKSSHSGNWYLDK